MDAIYLLSPQPHIVDCLLADFECRRYRLAYIIWTGVLPDALQRRLDVARRQMAGNYHAPVPSCSWANSRSPKPCRPA